MPRLDLDRPRMLPNCPKCRTALDRAAAPAACPACGLVFAKFLAASRGDPVREPREYEEFEVAPALAWWERLIDVPPQVESWQVYLRATCFAFFVVWGIRIWGMDVRDGEIAQSFMHNINLVFHEAGHMLFLPFGQFMHIAGGTLGQWLMPIVALVALHRQNRDNFGAALALWWLATSFMDAAPYAYDALKPQLVLLGGHTGEDGPHDWIEMLGDLHVLRHARGIGYVLHGVGTVLMLASFAWGAVVLYRQFRNRTDAPVLD